jgi:hypothetical protein
MFALADSTRQHMNISDARPPAFTKHLNQIELSRRWCVSPRTLERWRWLKVGPAYLRAGGRIVYRLEDIEDYEQANLHLTSDSRRPS